MKEIAVSETVKLQTFTATPNGRSIPADDINKSLDALSGFGQDDGGFLAQGLTGASFGLGGPHSRVWQWYAGTINTSIEDFQGTTIDRRLSDTGIRSTAFNIPLTGQEYSSTGWYFADPRVVISGSAAQQTLSANAIRGTTASVIQEGVGTGFFFGPDGGGYAYKPLSGAEKTPVTTDNTEAKLDGAAEIPVQSVFNGNFQEGIKQSLITHLEDPTAPWGRFPISYQLPGWSFHGGSGFKIDPQISLPIIGNVGPVDVTGLFVVPTDSADKLKDLINTYIGSSVDKLVAYLETLYESKVGKLNIPAAPDPGAAQNVLDQYNAIVGQLGLQETQAGQIADRIQSLLNQANAAFEPIKSTFTQLNDIFDFSTGKFNDDRVTAFKTFLVDNADAILATYLPSAKEGILFGGAAALQTILKSAITLATGSTTSDLQTFIDDIGNSIGLDSYFSTLTHDRLIVPKGDAYLDFSYYVPLALTPGTTLTVTVALDDGGTIAPGADLTNFGSAVAVHKAISISGAFFQDFHDNLQIPTAWQGHMVLISFKETNRDTSFVGPQDSNAPFTGSNNPLDAFSSLFLLEDVRLGATADANEYTPPPAHQIGDPSPAATGITTATLSLDDVDRVAAEARQDWIASGLVPDAASKLATVGLNVGLLADGAIGGYADGQITIDATGLERGWYTGDASEFTAGPNGTFVAITGTDAAQHFDLLTVLEHEYGHALGIADFPDGIVPGALMNTSLLEGVRILPSTRDTAPLPAAPVVTAPSVTRAEAAQVIAGSNANAVTFQSGPGNTPLAGPLANGTFTSTDPSNPAFAWATTGAVTATPDRATLAEARNAITSLSQTFTLAPSETTLSFIIYGGALFQDPGRAPDSFDVSLDDPSGRSVLGALGLSQTDDLFNLQSDGTLRLAPGVSVTGLTADGRLDLSAGAHVVTIDVSQVPRAENLTLDFALVTFGTHPAAVTIGDVGGTGIAGPIAVNEKATAVQGVPTTLDVLAQDGGVGLVLGAVTQPSHGTVAIVDGRVVYTASATYAGPDGFTYTVTDANHLSATGTVSVTVQTALVPPAPAADTAGVAENGTVLIDVLANDIGSGLVLVSAGMPAHGTAVIQDGKVLYTPTAGYTGVDSFAYTVRGSDGLSASASVAVTVAPVIVPPATTPVSASTVQGSPVLIDVLAHDVGTGISITSVSLPAHGAAVVQNGRILYTPVVGYIGGDAFTYVITGANGAAATGSVALTISAVMLPPVAVAASATTPQGTPVLIDVLAHDGGTGIALTAVGAPTNGTAVIQNGQILYTPTAGYTGPDGFSYTITGLGGATATANVAITVTSVIVPPVATPITAGTTQGQPVLIDVLAQDTGTGITLTSVTAPAHGVALLQDGKILYTPTTGYVGADGFTYTITGTSGPDAAGQTATGTITLTVTAAAPVANPVAASVVQGGSILIDVLGSDTGYGLMLGTIGAAAHGIASIENGRVRYTAGSDFVGADPLAYTIVDGTGRTSSGTITVTIVLAGSAGSLAPTVFSPALTVPENAAATTIGIAAPTDPAAGTLTVLLNALPGNGAVTLADGTAVTAGQSITVAQLTGLLFTPTPGLFGQASALAYSVTDPAGNVAHGLATLAIGPALGSPVAANPGPITAPRSGVTALGIGAPTDPNFAANTLLVVVRALPGNGVLTFADGTALAGVGQVLTIAQLAGLLFTPLPGAGPTASSFAYDVIDPASHVTGSAVPITVAAAGIVPTLGFVSPVDGSLVPLAITDAPTLGFLGHTDPGAGVMLSILPVPATSLADGSFGFVAGAAAPVTGQRLNVVATASGQASSAVGLLVLPPPDSTGTVVSDISSLDVANALHAGYSLQFTPGTEQVTLTDGVLSVGVDTTEAYVQRLYVGLLGRSYDAAGMTFYEHLITLGVTETTIAADFLASAEFVARGLPASGPALVSTLYASLLGRTPEFAGLAYYAAELPVLGEAGVAMQIANSPEAKAHGAFVTAKVLARNDDQTIVHDMYETLLGRETELGGLGFYLDMLKAGSLDDVARQMSAAPEALARHAGQSDAQFVGDLYATGLGRAPTTSDLSAGLAALQGGTRGQFLLQLARGAEARAHLTSDDLGQPPILGTVANLSVGEGQTVTLQLAAHDPDRTALTYGLVAGPGGATVSPAGLFTWTATATPSLDAVTVAATNAEGRSTTTAFSLSVVPGAPVLAATGPGTAIENRPTYVSLSATGPTPADAVTGWSVTWGDGSAAQTYAGAAIQPGHTYATAGAYTVQAIAITAGDGSFAAAPVPVSVAPGTLAATSVVAEATGFHARFDGVLDPATLTVLAGASGDAPNIIVTGPTAGIVDGSIVADPDGAGFRFVAASGALAAGTYRIVLRSGIQDARGGSLDGNDDGTPGDDLVTTITEPAALDELTIPAFMRGPGQAVNVPATGAGLPVTFSSDGTATSVVFTVGFDPSLLSLTSATAAAGLPTGATVGFAATTLADGRMQATITVASPTAIAAGQVALVDLIATVPATAPYGATEVLSLAVSSVNGIAQALPASSGLQVVGYLGDANGDGVYSSDDSARILRVVAGADTGFAFWRGVAPAVVADLNGDGAVTAADAPLVGTTSPPIPAGVTLVTASSTPFVSAPVNLMAAAGGNVTVPITLDRSVVLSSGTITLRYDPAALTLTAVRADPSSGLTVTPVTGHARNRHRHRHACEWRGVGRARVARFYGREGRRAGHAAAARPLGRHAGRPTARLPAGRRRHRRPPAGHPHAGQDNPAGGDGRGHRHQPEHDPRGPRPPARMTFVIDDDVWRTTA